MHPVTTNKKRYLRLLSFLVLILITYSLQAGNFTFRKYQVNHGLSENTVMCMLQDYQGFMWFGTKDGLNRFDGREFKIYKYNPANKFSIGNNFVRDLFQCNDSTIWVGTDHGLFIFNPATDRFTPFNHTTSNNTAIRSAVNSVCSDGHHSIWVGTMTQGVFRYNTLTGELTQYMASDERNSLQSNLAWKVYKDLSGTIWVGTRNGLSRFNNETGTFYTYSNTRGAGDLSNSEIMTIFQDTDGDLWVGTWSGGLSKLNRSTNTFRTWFNGQNSIYISHIRVIFEYEKNQLLIGSDDGLYLFDKATETVRRLDDPNDHNSLSDQNVYTITKDSEGGLWLGTYFGGVNYAPSLKKNIEHYYPSPAPHSMSGKAVSQFCEDERGNLWIGTEDGGLNYFDKKTGKFKVFLPDQSGNSLSYHNIHSLLLDGDNLWIGTFSRGLDVYNLKTRRFKNYRHNPADETTIDDDCIFSLYKNQQGEILVGTPYGLSKYNPTRDSFTRIAEVRSFVYKMKEDHLGNLWIATYGDGILKYSATNDSWKNYQYDPVNSHSIGFNKVIEVYLDNQHRLWFGTESRGLYRYNYESDDFHAIGEAQGLPNNTIYGVLDDKYGNLWVSTNKGIAKINNAWEVKNYTQSDGLQSDQFNYRSSFKSSDGLFHFGGINGFNIFNPDHIKENNHVPPVVITNLILLDVEAPAEYDSVIQHDFRSKKKITLSHNQASIRISFVSLSFLAPEKNQYAFRMDDYNHQWIQTTGVSEATYINLPPGKYMFRVKATNNDGVWNEQGDYLHIEVLPPFWKTIYAYIFYVLVVMGILFFTLYYYYRLTKERQQKRLEVFQKEKEKEVYNAKINFFTSIAHEIRTPVSLIKAPLECIINAKEGSGETRENLKVIERNTERLIQLINQLLDFRKIEEKLYKLNLTHVNLNQLVAEIFYRFHPTAEKANIVLTTDIPEETITGIIDREAVTKIISNLLTNALKYAQSNIKIKLAVEGNHFRIVVADDGPGIEEQYREKVFEPFYQVEPAKLSDKKPGTGIGLALTRQLVERQKGVIYVENNPLHAGCIMVVSIPLIVQPEMEDNEGNMIQEKNHDTGKEDAHVSGFTLLVVEDNQDLRDFIKKNLKHDFNILHAENGRKALDLVEKNHIDIVVSDVMMPVMDGIELVNHLKQNEQYSHIPVILLSARTNNEIKIEGLESGADCYIEKPFSMEFLKAQINSLLKNRVTMQEKFANSPLLSFGSIANNKKDEEFINKLNKEIEDNLTDSEYSIEKLSQSLSMSRSNLQRKIKGLTGMPPNDYIRIYRLKKAAILLQTSNYRINEICYLVGFNIPSYFSKCFQKQFGILPKDFVHNIHEKSEDIRSKI
jgi:ligand-binding sensor domain-containing protein/signal transduction histidine kinase/DNA-binding response OmpR family regulator